MIVGSFLTFLDTGWEFRSPSGLVLLESLYQIPAKQPASPHLDTPSDREHNTCRQEPFFGGEHLKLVFRSYSGNLPPLPLLPAGSSSAQN